MSESWEPSRTRQPHKALRTPGGLQQPRMRKATAPLPALGDVPAVSRECSCRAPSQGTTGRGASDRASAPSGPHSGGQMLAPRPLPPANKRGPGRQELRRGAGDPGHKRRVGLLAARVHISTGRRLPPSWRTCDGFSFLSHVRTGCVSQEDRTEKEQRRRRAPAILLLRAKPRGELHLPADVCTAPSPVGTWFCGLPCRQFLCHETHVCNILSTGA